MGAMIHVNRQFLAQNRKDGGKRPVYTIKQGRKTTYAHGVRIKGEVELVDPRETPPLSCGARAWIHVIDGQIDLVEPTTFADAKRQGEADDDFHTPDASGYSRADEDWFFGHDGRP